MPPTLRDYQVDLLERCRGHMRRGVQRVILQATTGAGKGVIAGKVCKDAVDKGSRVVVIAHRRRLVDQLSGHLDSFGVYHGIIMNGHGLKTDAPAQVVSRDTLLSRAINGDRIELPPADLVLVDEAHHSAAEIYQVLLSKWPNARALGLTATPATTEGKSLYPYWQALECACSTSELIRQGFLVPVDVYAPIGAKKRKKCGQKRVVAGDPIAQWIKYGQGLPTILFASKVTNSIAARDAFRLAGFRAEHFDASTPDDRREQLIEDVQGGLLDVLCNVSLCTEGTDIPELACAILLRMAGSQVLYRQIVGRILRPSPGKEKAVLIDHSAAFIDHGLPDEDVAWSLDTESTLDQREAKARQEGKKKEAIVCPSCGYVYSGNPVCPACGHEIKKRESSKKTAHSDEILVKVSGDPIRIAEATNDKRKAAWYMALNRTRKYDGKVAQAKVIYRASMHAWPEEHFPELASQLSGCNNQRKVREVFPRPGEEPVPRQADYHTEPPPVRKPAWQQFADEVNGIPGDCPFV